MATWAWEEAADWSARERLLAMGRRFRHERLVRTAIAKLAAAPHDLARLEDDEITALSSELLARLGGAVVCVVCNRGVEDHLERLGSTTCQDCRDGLGAWS